jgi:hypothetical protein
VRINDLYNSKFSILIVELLKGPVCFNVLEIEPDLISNMEANRWLAVSIREFFLLLLYYNKRLLSRRPIDYTYEVRAELLATIPK